MVARVDGILNGPPGETAQTKILVAGDAGSRVSSGYPLGRLPFAWSQARPIHHRPVGVEWGPSHAGTARSIADHPPEA